MAKFCSLFSSSKGNATYLASSETRIIVDAGVSCKRLTQALLHRGIDPQTIDAVLVTHDHSDHICGVKVFCSRYQIPIYATEKTIRSLDRSGTLTGKFDAFEVFPGRKLPIGDLTVSCVSTPHDREGSCCFFVEFPGERTAGIVTDLGHVTEEIHGMICESDLVLIESNNDRGMLMTGPYPFDLKKRIADPERGHLSNEQCAAECLAACMEGKTTRFFLGHLSEMNNLPELAFATTEAELKQAGIKLGVDCLLEVCKPENDGRVIPF